jgi:hypothetical protein
MKGLSMLAGVVAFLCMVMGIITATDVYTVSNLDYIFWFGLSGILFLATIALRIGREE